MNAHLASQVIFIFETLLVRVAAEYLIGQTQTIHFNAKDLVILAFLLIITALVLVIVTHLLLQYQILIIITFVKTLASFSQKIINAFPNVISLQSQAKTHIT